MTLEMVCSLFDGELSTPMSIALFVMSASSLLVVLGWTFSGCISPKLGKAREAVRGVLRAEPSD